MTKIALLKSRADRCGGLEKVTRCLADVFQERGCEVTILTSEVQDPSILDASPYIDLCGRSRLSYNSILRFDHACSNYLKSHPHDVVFGLDRNSQQTHYRAGNGCHAAYLQRRTLTDSRLKQLSFRFNPLHRRILELEKRTFTSPDLRVLFTNSNMVRREILEHYSVAPSRIEVIHNGVEWDQLAPAFSQWQVIRGSQEHCHRFLFVGQGYRRKGLGFLLEGLARIAEDNWTLWVVGKDKEEEAFRTQAQRLGISERIDFRGACTRDQVTELYQLADCLAIPSTYDPFANVTVEALAMGLFVLSSRLNGGCEVLTPQTGCCIQELLDPDSIAHALRTALDHPKTAESALAVRHSVSHLDHARQLNTMISRTLSTI